MDKRYRLPMNLPLNDFHKRSYMAEKTKGAKSSGTMKALPVRRSAAEKSAIKKLAKGAGLSEARLMVTAALLLAEFRTEEELRAAVHIGGLLWRARAEAVMQVRRVGHQLERLREELDPQANAPGLAQLEEVLAEVAATLKQLGATWRAR
jgi:hypothetical protein